MTDYEDQRELCRIIDSIEKLTDKVCPRVKQFHDPKQDICIGLPNCPIGQPEEMAGYHCRLCAASALLIRVRNSEALLQ